MIWRIGRAQTMWTDSSDGVNPVYNVPASIRLHAVFDARPKWFHPLTHNPGTGPCCFHRLESFPINLPWIHKCKGLFEGRIYWMMVQRFQNGNSSDWWSEATTDMSNRGAAGERRWICVFVFAAGGGGGVFVYLCICICSRRRRRCIRPANEFGNSRHE